MCLGFIAKHFDIGTDSGFDFPLRNTSTVFLAISMALTSPTSYTSHTKRHYVSDEDVIITTGDDHELTIFAVGWSYKNAGPN